MESHPSSKQVSNVDEIQTLYSAVFIFYFVGNNISKSVAQQVNRILRLNLWFIGFASGCCRSGLIVKGILEAKDKTVRKSKASFITSASKIFIFFLLKHKLVN
jgi:hypothetical protein